MSALSARELREAPLGTVVSAESLRPYHRLMSGTPFGFDASFALKLIASEWIRVICPLELLNRSADGAPVAQSHLERWLSQLEAGLLPPVIADLGRGVILDGKHRAAAAREAGQDEIAAWVGLHKSGDRRWTARYEAALERCAGVPMECAR